MGGRITLRPEVLARRHQAAAEHLLPEAVHRHPARQRIGVVDQPAGQAEAVPRHRRRHRRKDGRDAGCDPLARLVVHPAVQDVRLRLGVQPLMHDVGDAAAPAHLPPLPLDRAAASEEPLVGVVLHAEEVEAQRLALRVVEGVQPLRARALQRRPERHDPRLLHRQRPVEDAQVGYSAAVEVAHLEVVAAAPAGRRRAPEQERTPGPDAPDHLREELAPRRLDRLPVAEDVEPRALARAVVGNHDVRPLAGRHPLQVARRDARRWAARPLWVLVAGHAEGELPRPDGHRPAA